MSDSILHEAHTLVHGTRQEAYDHPRENFKRIATLWSVILKTDVTAADIPLCMIAVKLSRQAYAAKRDNLVDIAGYAETASMLDG